jgi:putative ABC transport system substrate-binding protein
MIRRRDFITLLGGAAAWPLAVRAQQDRRPRVVAMLIAASANDPEFETRLEAFRQTLANLGWVGGRNLRTELRYGTGDTSECGMA